MKPFLSAQQQAAESINAKIMITTHVNKIQPSRHIQSGLDNWYNCLPAPLLALDMTKSTTTYSQCNAICSCNLV